MGGTALYFADAGCVTTPYIRVQNSNPVDFADATAADRFNPSGDSHVYYPKLARSEFTLDYVMDIGNGACSADTTTAHFAEAQGPLIFRPPFTIENQ